MEEFDELAELIEKYVVVFDTAWEDFLNDIEKGKVWPRNEAEMRSCLFSKCLIAMEDLKLEIPYQIHQEDVVVYGRRRADLTLGYIPGNRRCVTVEMKFFRGFESIRKDVMKLREFIKENRFGVGYSVMVGDSRRNYRENLGLKDLGISDEYCKWHRIKAPTAKVPYDTLKVFIAE